MSHVSLRGLAPGFTQAQGSAHSLAPGHTAQLEAGGGAQRTQSLHTLSWLDEPEPAPLQAAGEELLCPITTELMVDPVRHLRFPSAPSANAFL